MNASRLSYCVCITMMINVSFNLANSNEISEKYCNPPIREALDRLGRIEIFVPHVPPDEAIYLDKEEKAALAMEDRERFEVMAGRSTYSEWKFHKAVDAARRKLNSIILNKSINDPIVLLRTQLFSIGDLPILLSNVRDAWDSYVEFQGRKLNARQRQDGYMWTNLLIYDISSYIDCLAESINTK